MLKNIKRGIQLNSLEHAVKSPTVTVNVFHTVRGSCILSANIWWLCS